MEENGYEFSAGSREERDRAPALRFTLVQGMAGKTV